MESLVSTRSGPWAVLLLLSLALMPAAHAVCPGSDNTGATMAGVQQFWAKVSSWSYVTTTQTGPLWNFVGTDICTHQAYAPATSCRFTRSLATNMTAGTVSYQFVSLAVMWPNITARNGGGSCRFTCGGNSCRIDNQGLPVELLDFSVEEESD